jgi:hypothetical protein
MKNRRLYLNLLAFFGLIVLFTLLETKFFFAQDLKPVPTSAPDIWSEESSLVHVYSYQYKVPIKTISNIGHRIDDNDDVSVCLYVAKKRGYDPLDILGLKKRGLPWKEIFKIVGLDMENLFTETNILYVSKVPGRFRHAVGEYHKWRKDPTYPMDLTDNDVRDMVQMQFVMTQQGLPAGQVMDIRNSGADWNVVILGGAY